MLSALIISTLSAGIGSTFICFINFLNWFGFIIDLTGSYETESERGLALEPPIVSSLSLTLNSLGTAGNSYIATVMFVPELNPADYAAGDLRPGYRDEWIIAETTSTVLTANTTVDCGWQTGVISSGAQTTNSAGATINTSDTGDLVANWGRLQSYMQNSQWSGIIAISMYVEVSAGFAFYAGPPSATVTQNTFHSGHVTNRLHRGRIRHCPRSGLPGYANEFIDDGYIEGLKVSQDWYEPEDRSGTDIITPSEEGVIDDEAQ